jgi:probable rRNA maturation factor
VTRSQQPWLEIVHAHPNLRIGEDRLTRLVEDIFKNESRLCESLGVILADRETVLELNRTYLKHDYPTDVLSFLLEPDDGTSPLQGEIYVDLDTALERHEEFSSSFEDEALRYVIHGVLHLLGYDDDTEDTRGRMNDLENRYLRRP